MSARRTPSIKLELEALEDRWVPTSATFSNGILSVVGTDAAETIRLTQNATQIVVEGVGYVNTASVRSIVINARGGDDYVDARTLKLGATIYAGAGNDFVVGTAAIDYIFGGAGNDRLFGMDGNDVLQGEAGNDRLFGGNGGDALYGQDGNDFLDDGNRSSQEYADGGLGMDWNADVVAVNGTAYSDVNQRGAPTCGFLSTLSGLARKGTDFTRYISYSGFTGDGTPQYDVWFWKSTGWTTTRVAFDGNLTSTDTAPAAEGESWVILMQRAWIQFHGNGGRTWPHEAAFALTGQTGDFRYSVSDADFNRFATALASNRLVTVATVSSPNGVLVGDHAYTVVQTWGSGSNRWVQLRNPWGYDGGRLSDGSDPNDGLVWVRWSDFLASVRYSDVV